MQVCFKQSLGLYKTYTKKFKVSMHVLGRSGAPSALIQANRRSEKAVVSAPHLTPNDRLFNDARRAVCLGTDRQSSKVEPHCFEKGIH